MILLYLHIPKTAGTTLNACIYEQTRTEDYYESEEGFLYSGVYWYPGPNPAYGFFKELDYQIPHGALRALERTDLKAVIGHFSFGIHRFLSDHAIYVTLVREPVARIISLYNHLSPEMSLEEFVVNYTIDGYRADQTRLITDNDQTRRISGIEPHFGECSTKMLAVAKANLRKYFAVVGVTERFDESLLMMKIKLNWSKKLVYQSKRVSRRLPSLSTISDRTLGLIREYNKFDIELHQFAQQLLDEQIANEGMDFARQFDEIKANIVPGE